ncbi:hypothetical protein ACQKM2_01450 [Streptomyces sp. NPDC004126]|uniref:hypothetical protein n=1 Tax=Streptomyces sp. NPDC004126 TaxID=3390695 RepID=UPI003CFC6BFB
MTRRKRHRTHPRPARPARRQEGNLLDRVLGAFVTGVVAVIVKEAASLLHRG